MKDKGPDRLYVEKSVYEEFNRLAQKDSPLSSKQAKHIFMLAMALGFKNELRSRIETKKELVRLEYVHDNEKSVINALAVHEEGLAVLLDKNRVYRIAEEYASGGIKLLNEMVFSKKGGSFIKKLESDLLQEYEEFFKP